MKGKIKPGKPVGGTQFGTTVHDSDPAKFNQKGKTEGKTKANDILSQKEGPVFTANRTHIPSTDADKKPRETKQMEERDWIDPHEKATCKDGSTEGTSGGFDEYPLKKSYEK